MKTKLSFLALPFCLGLVLAFMLSACDSGGGGNKDEKSSSSAGGGSNPTPSSEKDNASINWDPDPPEISISNDKLRIRGKIIAIGKEANIVKVKFSPSGWVEYDGSLTEATQTFILTGNTVVDLTNSAIPCGSKQNITIEACLTDDCKASSLRNVPFEKECAISSSETTAPSSSSAKAVWKFGAPDTKEVRANKDVELGSGKFKLVGDDDMESQPAIQVTGGRVQSVIALCDDECDDVEVGKAYEAYSGRDSEDHLGTEAPKGSSFEPVYIGSIRSEFYLLVIGSDKYLLAFEAGPSGDVSKWPKKCIIWKATESPY